MHNDCPRTSCQSIEILENKNRIFTTENRDEMRIGLGGGYIKRLELEAPPEATETGPTLNFVETWSIIQPEVNKEYIFEGTIIFNKPTDKIGIHRYVIFIIGHTQGWVFTGSETTIFLDDEGNEMDPEMVKTLLYQPPELVQEVTGFIDFPTDTPRPTFPPPTATETNTLTPTETPINYPAPKHSEAPIIYPAPVTTPFP